MHYVYILKGTKHYVGITNNLSRRIGEHQRGNNYFTKRIGEHIQLLGYFVCESKGLAIDLETKIKKSGHIERYLQHKDFVWVSSSIGEQSR